MSAVSVGFFVARADIRDAMPETVESVNPDPTPDPNLAPHTLVGSYYTLDENIDAKLLLNNKGATQLEVLPTLYSADGQELVLPPVYVDAQSFRFINLQDWAAVGGNSFRSGNIKLFHLGKDLVLGAQMYLTHEGKSLTFEEKLVEVGKFNSTRQEAVWSMPSDNAEVRVVLTNTTATALDVTGTIAKKANNVSDPRTITIPPHSTRAFELRDEFPGSNSYLNSDVVAMSLEHCGSNEALLARLLVYEQNKGFSNTVQFSNPAGGKSNRYEGVGFQIEEIGNQNMNPFIVARNVGTATSTVTANVPYTRVNGTRGNIALPSLSLSPGEMRAFNAKQIMQRTDDENIKVASLEIAYTTAPGSVIVGTHSQSNNRDHVFRVPMWDPLGQKSPTGGYPWMVDGSSSTETYIKNISNLEEDYGLTVLWEGGIYVMARTPIAAHETVHIDVKSLRDEQIPDIAGRTIPPSVSSGQIKWSIRRKDNLPLDDQWANLSLIGRSEQVDLERRVVNNYACQNWCQNTVRPNSGYILPDDVTIEAGEYVQFEAWHTLEDTYGGYVGEEQAFSPSWNSGNPSVVSIDAVGLAYGLSLGEGITISANWDGDTHFSTEPCEARPQLAGSSKLASCESAPKAITPEDGGGGTCGSCGHETTPLSDATGVGVRPKVTIDSFKAVGKDQTAIINVANPGNANITLTLSAHSGTGEAHFTNTNSTTRTISTTTNVEIKGITQSNTKDNMRLVASYDSQPLGSGEAFTVVAISFSLRLAGTDNVSTDNAGRSTYNSVIGTYQLGGPFLSSGTGTFLWRNGVEIVATILPSNFSDSIILQREVILTKLYNEANQLESSSGPFADTSDPVIRDDNPQSGSSGGKVYDLDAPGININVNGAVGTIRRRRTNFRQWATISQKQAGTTSDVRISVDVEWFSRVSVVKISSGVTQVNNDVTSDNQIASGSTLLTWNLQ